MKRWNVVASLYEGEFHEARRLLAPFGHVYPSEFHNVLVMQVDDPIEFLAAVQVVLESDASLANSVSRIVPVTERFEFNSVEEFGEKAASRVDVFLPKMTGSRFFVRVVRRGFKGKMSSREEERKLGEVVREHLGANTAIDFDDPDWILVVEVLGNSAGMAVWRREELKKYELLRIE